MVEIKAADTADALVTASEAMLAVPDSGCKRSVAGRRWHVDLRRVLAEKGLRPIRRRISESFRFGDGNVLPASWSYVHLVGIFGANGCLDVALADRCPPLMSSKAMHDLGVVLDFALETITVEAAGAKDKPQTGHPRTGLFDFGAGSWSP